jgi:hypothetical protein
VARQFFLRQQNSQAAEKNRGPSWRRGRTVALLKSKPTTQGGELRETKEPANKNHGNSVAGWRNSRENQPPDSGACGRNLSRRASNPNTQKEKSTTAAAQGVGTRRRRFGREQEHGRRRASEENEKTKKQTERRAVSPGETTRTAAPLNEETKRKNSGGALLGRSQTLTLFQQQTNRAGPSAGRPKH